MTSVGTGTEGGGWAEHQGACAVYAPGGSEPAVRRGSNPPNRTSMGGDSSRSPVPTSSDTRPICECCRQRPADVMDTFSDGAYFLVCCACLNDGRAFRAS